MTDIERVRQMVALAREGRLPAVGALFNASHASMRDDFEISCTDLEVAVEAAITHGALCARMTGGGFGPRLRAHRPHDSGDSSRHARLLPTNGFSAPSCFAVTAGGPTWRGS